MTEVAIIGKPDLRGKRLAFALAEDWVAHYPEFRDFFIRVFDLDNRSPRLRPADASRRRGRPLRAIAPSPEETLE
jgi:hypothetical protein